jgi:hypothetical protein
MIAEYLLNKEGGADGIGHRPEDSPANHGLLADLTAHLPEREGLDVVAVAVSTESRWKEDNRRRAVWRGEAWGQVLGTERAVRMCARFRKWLASPTFCEPRR